MTWKALLQETLSGLARTHAHEPLSEIQRILRGVFSLEEVHFQGPDGRELRPDATLQQALEVCAAVVTKVQLRPADPAASAVAVTSGAARAVAGAAESRFREGVPTPDISRLSMEERTDLFLREFIRLENRHDFMWAGYIVRELLPRLGFAPDEAKLVLDHLRAEKLVTISKVPNPKNPEFPATGVHLNHEHSRVRAMLGDHAQGDGAVTSKAHDPAASCRANEPATAPKAHEGVASGRLHDRTVPAKSPDGALRPKPHDGAASAKVEDGSAASKPQDGAATPKSHDRVSTVKAHEGPATIKTHDDPTAAKSEEPAAAIKPHDSALPTGQ